MRNRSVEEIKNKTFFFFLQTSYSEFVLIQAHYSLVLNLLRFNMFDESGFLSFEVLKMFLKKY